MITANVEPVLRRTGLSQAPLSHAQQRLWFIDAADPGAATYHVPLLLRWLEPLDPAALSAALTAVVDRHAVLRTRYHLVEGQPVQEVTQSVTPRLDVVDLTGDPNPEDRLHAEAAAAACEPFDLAGGTLVRCRVWQGVPGGDAALITFHHIAIDGWSLSVFFADLEDAYGAVLAGRPVELAEPEIRYIDFAVWDGEVTGGDAARKRLTARAAELRPYASPLVLGLGEARRGGAQTRPGGQVVFEVGDPLRADVHRLAARLRVTPFVVLLAAYQEVLRRWSGRGEFLVGTVTANRPHPATEKLVGFFVNTVPLRCAPQAEDSFSALCGEVRKEAFRSLTHQLIPFDQLSAEIGGNGPLVQVGFALQNMPAWDSVRPRWRAPVQLPTGTAKFDLLLILEERPDAIVGTVEYADDMYSSDLAVEFAGHFQVLLAAAVADPDQRVCHLPLTRREPDLVPPCVLVGPVSDLAGARAAMIGGVA
ncbi:condensation domain-containing protein [Micromonospora sp. DT229]|uniref:condensation domain-containing protein n=1 Tax=Micromonospora sp. DT229 TaxID=3393430 RepID=UPI003CF1F22F